MGFVFMIFFGHVVVAGCNWSVPRVPLTATRENACLEQSEDFCKGPVAMFFLVINPLTKVLDSTGLIGLQVALLAPNLISACGLDLAYKDRRQRSHTDCSGTKIWSAWEGHVGGMPRVCHSM